MTRRTMAERKRRGADRIARRESLLVLLARARRGVTLTDAEAALLFAHVEVELAEADELRRTVQGQQTAIQVMGNRADAADAVIVEVEQDRDQARAELAQLQARDRAERSAPDAEHAAMNRHLDRMRTRAEQAEAALARVRNARTLGDALATVAEHDGMPPETARVHGRILDQGDAVEARLAEQQRAHEIELATARRALSDTETIGHRLLQRAERAEGRLAQVERRADISEQQAETLRREVNRAEEDARAEHRRGDGWKRHALDTDHKADRYRTAWFAARRDRKADRAAMAAELPLIEAGRAALARVALDRADLLAALTR